MSQHYELLADDERGAGGVCAAECVLVYLDPNVTIPNVPETVSELWQTSLG